REAKENSPPRASWMQTMVSRRRSGAALAEIEAVYRSRFAQFCSVAAAVLNDRDTARDAVQDAFARAVRNRRDFRGDGTLEAWLWRAVVNTAVSARRKNTALTFPDPAPQADDDQTDDARAAI